MIVYCVLTCDKYKDTRFRAQLETWAKDRRIAEIGTSFLLSVGIEDSYEQVPRKYVEFFRKSVPVDVWSVFVDDDTYVDTKKLEEQLSCHVYESPTCLGDFREATGSSMNLLHGKREHKNLNCLRGGAGFAMNKLAFDAVKNYVVETPIDDIPCSVYGDASVSMWLEAANVTCVDAKGNMFNRGSGNLSAYCTMCQLSPERMRSIHART